MSVNPYSAASSPALTECWFQRARSASAAIRRDRTPDVTGRFRLREIGRRGREAGLGSPRLERVAPVLLGHPERVEHHLGTEESGRDRDRGRVVRAQLMPLREREPGRRRSWPGRRTPRAGSANALYVVGAVGHLHHQSSRPVDDERKEVMRRDEVRVDREAEDAQARLEIVLPDGRVPIGRSTLQELRAPDVVDQHVDVTVIGSDPGREIRNLFGLEMVDGESRRRFRRAR